MTLDEAAEKMAELTEQYLSKLPPQEQRIILRRLKKAVRQAERRLEHIPRNSYQRTVIEPAQRLADWLECEDATSQEGQHG